MKEDVKTICKTKETASPPFYCYVAVSQESVDSKQYQINIVRLLENIGKIRIYKTHHSCNKWIYLSVKTEFYQAEIYSGYKRMISQDGVFPLPDWRDNILSNILLNSPGTPVGSVTFFLSLD